MEGAEKILLKSLTQEEYDGIQEEVRCKIETFINLHIEDFITSRASFETTRASNDEKIQNLSQLVSTLENERDKLKNELSLAKDELADIEITLKATKEENEKLQETIKKQEVDCVEYRRQRDLAVDERNEAVKMVERRDNEVRRMAEDVASLTNQLQAAIQAKCEAIANADEVESLKLALDYREKRLDQERGLLTQQLQSLTEDLARQTSDMTNVRREHTNTIITLRTQLAEKTEELKIVTSTNEELKESKESLNKRIEQLREKLIGQCDTENQMHENYREEIQAQTKLAELYKGLSEDATAKNEELTSAVQELQRLIKEASEQFGELEAKVREKEVALEVTTEKKNTCIQELKKELEHANQLLQASKQESQEKAVESLCPMAATTSRLLKSGLTLTQLYMQYAEASEQLMLEKQENKRLNNSITIILQEIEQKAPLLRKQREDYDYAMTTLESLTTRMDEVEVENSRLRSANLEAEKIADHIKRENKRLQDTVKDLSRQVCFLLKEVEECRGNAVQMTRSPGERSADLTTCSQIISKRLVTFGDIEELQVTNQRLLSVVRELSEKQEQAEQEQGSQLVEQLESKLRLAEQRITALRESEAHYQRTSEIIKGQREMYRTLFQQQVAGLPPHKVVELEKAASVCQQGPGSEPATPEGKLSAPTTPSAAAHQSKIDMLEQMLKEKTKELQQLQEDFNSYRKELSINERMTNETLEKCREELRTVSVSKSEVVAKLEIAQEKFTVLKANADSYRGQIQALENKNKNYSVTIGRHEQSISHLREECMAANTKLSRAEVELCNLRKDFQLAKESEARLLKERENRERTVSSQALLMSNLEMLKVSFERSQSEAQLKLQEKCEEAQKECSALRRRLQEEQDRFRERTDALERSTETARSRLDEEKEVSHQLRLQLNTLRQELKESKEMIEQLNAKVRTTSHKVVPDPQTEKRAQMLEQQMAEKDGELACLSDQLAAAKKQMQDLSDLAQSSEKQLLEVSASHAKFKEDSEAQLKTLNTREDEMKKLIADLEGRVASLSSAQQESQQQHLSRSSAASEVASLRAQLEEQREELVSLRSQCQAAEDKYTHEIQLHADDVQSIDKVRRELNEVTGRVENTELERNTAVEALKQGREDWAAREASLTQQLGELTQRLTDLDTQNTLLHNQLQELGLKVAVIPSQANTSSGSLDTSLEDDTRSSDQLLQVLKYLRREKSIAVAQADALRAEALRLRAQCELQSRQLADAGELLTAERSQAQASVTTHARHEELLRKVDTLNALTDSNRVLREEKTKLAERVASLEQELAKVETERIAPFKDRVARLTNHAEQVSTENTALKAEAARWRTRANALIEKQNKNSPDDFKRLQNEKEALTKQVTALSEELKTVKLEKSKFEEQLNNMRKEMEQLSERVTAADRNLLQTKAELGEARVEAAKRTEEVAKLSQDLSTQEAALQDIKSKELQIRQIAKKYKTQYQELVKSSEDDRRKQQAVAVMTPEEQERLREEGRQEAETRQTDRLKQLTDQVTTTQTEAVTLRKENEQLRATNADKEQRAKELLKNARNRIMILTDEKRKLATENTELKNKVETLDRNKDDSDVRQQRADKEKSALTAENERLKREVEILTQRATALQRQVDKLQGGVKPSTSSGADKSSVEPPTANIKPMAGPSSSVPKQQPSQHSVTVTPWRGGGGETPFASIRPMSLQTRTAAVLPTTNQSSQAVLVPPQQQMVHTSTGTVEGLSSSPTSSHTDYMPATSSGVAVTIRQATVPPTQLPPPAESTQEMEAEGSQASGSIQAPGAANTQALSIALVLPQPTAQTSTQTTQTQGSGQDSAVSAGLEQRESREQVEQSVVSASSLMPSDQGLVSASSNQQSMCSTVPAYYRQEVEDSSQGVASTATEQSVTASSESQLAEASNSAEQSAAAGVASSYANSSNTVTTSQAGPGKRLRDTSGPAEEEPTKSMPPAKRTRTMPLVEAMRADVLEVEYQVPTSSQRDQEDDVILIDTEDEDEDEDEEGLPDDGGLDDGQEFEEGDNEEGYEMEVYSREDQDMVSYDVGEGPDIDDNITEQDNNEVDVIEDSNEVPNQSESSSSGVGASGGEAGGEATSSGQGGGAVSSGQYTHTRTPRSTHIPPLNRQQQLLLPGSYEEVGDDSIVPSTPTLFLPRRTDGFGEAVSSPHVPSARFTFADNNNAPTTRAGVAQVASEGMDDTRMDLSQLEDSGTGRSVPSTPLQVSPQEPGGVCGAEVGQSGSEDQLVETNNNTHLHIPSITVTTAPPSSGDLEDVSTEEVREGEGEEQGPEAGGPDAPLHDEPEMDPEESGDGVSSEGEKAPAVVEEAEEGREAEATESAAVPRGSGTARRSSRAGAVRGRPTRTHTPIVWDDQPAPAATSIIARGSSPLFPRGRTITIPNRSALLDPARGLFRGRPRRRSGGPFHFQPRFI